MKKIAIDIDGVLADLAMPLMDFCNVRYGTKIEVKDLHSFDFKEIFEITKEEERSFLLDFFKTDYFQNIQPIKDSQNGINALSKNNSLNIITARPKYVENETRLWLERFYENVFSKIHFAENIYASGRPTTLKSDFCLNNDYSVMIEDDSRYANDCSEKGIETILITRPWNKNQFIHLNVKRVEDWESILRVLQ